MDDGRLNILARGTRPSGCSSARTTSPTRRAWSSSSTRAPRSPTSEAARTARELYRELVGQATDRELERRRAARAGRLRGWPPRWSSASRPSRSCSSCARRTRACGCSRCCCAAAIERLELRRARPGARALQRQGPLRLSAGRAAGRSLAAGGRPAGRSAARTAPVRAGPAAGRRSCRLKRTRPVFVAHVVAAAPSPAAAAATGVLEAGSCRSSWIARACDELRVAQLQRRAAVAVHAAFFVDEQRQARAAAWLPVRVTMNRSGAR